MSIDVIRVENVSKYFTVRKQNSFKESIVNARRGKLHEERFTALQDIDLTIQAGESVGLIGPNGSGKSTLLKIIGGILMVDAGRVLVRGRIAPLLELGTGFNPDLTGRENVFLNASLLGLTRRETARYFDDIVEFSGISDFIDTQVKFYSSGMYVRLAFSVAVHVDPDILLVDEVLAVGDEPYQAKCMDKINTFKAEGRTIILVSHSSKQVLDVCNRALVLQHGKAIIQATPKEALERLRKDYSEMIDATVHDYRGISNYNATVDSVTLRGIASPFEGQIEAGDGLAVNIEVTLPQPIPGGHVQVAFENVVGQKCIITDTAKNLQQDMSSWVGTHRMSLVFPKLFLTEGDYTVKVTVSDGDDITLAQNSYAASFSVSSGKRTSGFVDCDVQFATGAAATTG